MRIAVTGGDGFVGRYVVDRLRAEQHEPVVLSRRTGVDLATVAHAALSARLDGCAAVVLCAGINRELGMQTYERVHVAATRAIVEAARDTGVERIVLLSFLRARADGPSPYHRSKWAAETIVQGSGLAHTILKPGVIHGRGDHLLDHLTRAFRTFPVFGLVGVRGREQRWVRPVAVDDVARIIVAAAVGDPRLRDRTIAVVGPERMPLDIAVGRVAAVVGRRTRAIPLPIAVHRLLGRISEATMVVPLISRAQVEILAEGVAEPTPPFDWPPPDLAPATPFDHAAIRAGLPIDQDGFGRRDLRGCLAGPPLSREG